VTTPNPQNVSRPGAAGAVRLKHTTAVRLKPARTHRAIEAAIAMVGIAMAASAAAATQSWLDRHFLPSFFMPRAWYVGIETAVRAAIACAGGLLVLARRPISRLLARAPRMIASIAVAAVLALVTSEAVLRAVHLRPTEWLLPEEEPLRQPDARLGWVLAPGRTGRTQVGGRTVEYAVDSSGYRVARAEHPVDPDRPTIVFVGESVMFGEGLTWDESIPAQVEAMVGIQSANLAVHGYSNDQAYLRLVSELPTFRRPVAVVGIFMTELFGRNLDDDRPHLAPGLVWAPATQHARLQTLAKLVVPFRRDRTVERAVQVTGEALRALVHLADSRGATPLILVPQFGAEDDASANLRQRIVTDDIPTVRVVLDASWRLPWDRHPNARAAHLLAAAIAARLQESGSIHHD
jgi:hypothetical protein